MKLAIVILIVTWLGLASVNCSSSEQKQQLSVASKAVPLKSCFPYQSVCANSTADLSFNVRYQSQCINECQRGGENSACVGVNYRPLTNICEIYNYCPTSYTGDEAGCSYFQNDMTADRKNCLVFVGPVLTYSIPGSISVQGVAQLNDQLFVSRSQSQTTGQIDVYNTNTFQLSGTILFSTLTLYGLAADQTNNLIFVSEDGSPGKVYVIIPSTLTKTSWIAGEGPRGLSVNSAHNVLVVCGFAGAMMIREYTSTGSVVSTINVPATDYYPFMAIEVSTGILAVSFWGSTTTNKVVLMTDSGQIQKSYGSTTPGSGFGQLNLPFGLAVDKKGFVLVADRNNNRIIALDPTLSRATNVTLPLSNADQLVNPRSVWLDESRGRLYIGEVGGQRRVLVFDNFFVNSTVAFCP